MAAMATRTVLDLLAGRIDGSSSRIELTTSLIVRASTAPPRRKVAAGMNEKGHDDHVQR